MQRTLTDLIMPQKNIDLRDNFGITQCIIDKENNA